MSETIKIVHVCDHVVPKKEFIRRSAVVMRSESQDFDTVSNLALDEVSFVEYGGKLFFNLLHFMIFAENKIKWICHPNVAPAPGTEYTAHISEVKETKVNYDIDDCPMCGGNGWYVGAVSRDDFSISVATGVDKLVQDFLKALLTDSRYYSPGTSMKSRIGEMYGQTSSATVSINAAVAEAESFVKAFQYETSMSGSEIPVDEILKAVKVEAIDRSTSGDGYYVQITLINQSDLALSIGLDL